MHAHARSADTSSALSRLGPPALALAPSLPLVRRCLLCACARGRLELFLMLAGGGSNSPRSQDEGQEEGEQQEGR